MLVVSALTGGDHQGLSVAAREARRRGLLSGTMARKFANLDISTHMARHKTRARMVAFLDELSADVSRHSGKGDEYEALGAQVVMTLGEVSTGASSAVHPIVTLDADTQKQQAVTIGAPTLRALGDQGGPPAC